MESTQILNVRLDEMLDAICHDGAEVANVNRLCQKCIIQKAIPRELYSVTRCNVFASIQFSKAIKVKEIDMECPGCKGLKIIHVRAVPGVHQQYDVECPVCDGTGELPDSAELPNHCPACGEPVRAGETWCDRHKSAEQLE